MLKLDSSLQILVYRYLASWAADIKALAQKLVPVRTGYLRSTIYAVVKDWAANIGADATYAYFVEAGTKHMRAQPYLYPALQAYLPMLEEIIVAAIDAAKVEACLQ
jgi:HK97 gp10 family phage protein